MNKPEPTEEEKKRHDEKLELEVETGKKELPDESDEKEACAGALENEFINLGE